ncbi:helix-turn-helix transcriptional regulator [Mucilaginibacter sp. RS28]|uniref:Helix-turn-helix transcriptional regulator n=1 Tax=Mucilaginibacter straminoryzae TaxID=2932774 RepID=A0A9X1X3L3_9SPHI|nr:helix-turn-helix transcriptional regulator [Mucilaginibacter straminoryzae]MCJ8209675.1 helix-turn-helix transcriptional regulator [Mucilaginibacter straminoryzae]
MPDNQKDIFFTTIESKIRLLAKQRKITLSELSSAIGMTEAGFYKMLSTDSIKVKTLKKIAEALHQPIVVFFEEEKTYKTDSYKEYPPIALAAEPESQYLNEKETLKKHIELLESQISDKNKIIELLSKK